MLVYVCAPLIAQAGNDVLLSSLFMWATRDMVQSAATMLLSDYRQITMINFFITKKKQEAFKFIWRMIANSSITCTGDVSTQKQTHTHVSKT